MFASTTTLVFAFLALGLEVSGQTPSPTPDNDVVRISTNLIRLDVTVSDKNGKPIADIRPEEIEIFENGKKQKITGLNFVSASRERVIQSERRDTPTVAPTPPPILRAEQVRRAVALVVDDLTLSFESVYQTRRALKKFVDEQMEDGDLVAIIRTGAGVGALQQFTTDKRVLYAAIEKVRWNPVGTGGISAFAPLDALDAAEEEAEEAAGERTIEGIRREFDDRRESYFSTGSLGAINFVINGMGELPGRKSVILFSDGFRLTNVDAEGFTVNSGVVEPIRRLIEAANRASVVIYTMDPRGLVYTGLTAADNTGTRSRERIDSDLAVRRERLADTQDSLRYIAKETGGFALVNNNDLPGGVRRVLEDQSYYLVSYEPDEDTFDPVKRKFNKIEVKVSRPGASVRYRSGFFNVADRPTEPNAPAADRIDRALVSPIGASGISVRLNALFGNDPKSASYVRSLLHIDANDLQFTEAEGGQKKATFEVLAMSFGDNGVPVDQLAKSYTLTVTEPALARLRKDGFVYHFIFPVKKAGPYQYRVAVRDPSNGKIGSASQFVDIPDLKKKRLATSSIVLESLTSDEWRQALGPQGSTVASDPLGDTALRRVMQNSVLRYGYEIYNARLDKTKQPQLTTRVRIYRDGKPILDGKEMPLQLSGQTDLARIKASGAIALGTSISPGDYILQIVVLDRLAEKGKQIASEFVQFEVVAR